MTDKINPAFTEAADWNLETRLVRGGTNRSEFGETSEALFLSSGYVYDSPESAEARFNGEEDGFVYSRYGNPTVQMFEDRMALLEDAETCFATASGMAAVWAALICQLKTGDHVVAARALFGSCHHIVTKIFPKFGIEATLIDGTDIAQWQSAVKSNTKVFFFETPSNPTLEIIDIPAVVAIAKQAGARVVVDNVFSTPILQQPIRLGADISVYSGTKHIDGQGRTLGGAVLCSNEFRKDYLEPFMRHTGGCLSPFNAWVLLKGLETLDLRVRRQSENALAIADFLESHAAISRVIYPGLASHPQHALAAKQMSGFGTLVSFDVKGGKDAAFKLLNGLKIVDISNNLGDTKSLITHPYTTTHRAMEEADRQALGIGQGLVRISAGIESKDDLLADFTRALGKL
ncbi:O-succinylhomoserine sulfhydrylase [Nisaea denitrificans]|uniref:O-succinylhomoserine sulfhydrylase n=1 Tax=Nisaea denitrificans TaxID=390877 RepID=UPI00040C851E|nr:O-succinylhomoserine sulfhydrylase [Nisaea denitrificans]